MRNPFSLIIEGSPYRFAKPVWWPFEVNCTSRHGLQFYCFLPKGYCLQTRFYLEAEDVELWKKAGLYLTRPETPEEEQERLDSWAEEAFMEYELNRYTQWAY